MISLTSLIVFEALSIAFSAPCLATLRKYSLFDDNKDKIVLDPYVGSGTVPLAAKLFGCSYCGIDISEKYLDMAKDKLENYNNYIGIYQNEKNSEYERRPGRRRPSESARLRENVRRNIAVV